MKYSEKYTKDGWETLNFTNITLSSSNLSFNAAANFTFKGIVNKSRNITIPYDINLCWGNNSCTPSKGWWNETFNYSIDVKAERKGTVELQINCNKSKDDWEPKGERKPYNKTPKWQTMNWTTIKKPCGEYEGNTNYKFVFYLEGKKNNETTPYTGPKLFIPINIKINSSNVIPNESIYYIENNILQNYFENENIPFNYTANISAAKNTTVKPVIIDPHGNRTIGYEKNYSDGNEIKELNWTIKTFNAECLGMWNYTFNYSDRRPGWEGWEEYDEEFEGPKQIASFKDFDIDPEPPFLYGESCNVTTVVNGSRNISITLELCNSTVCKPVQNGTQIYNLSEGEKDKVWKGIKPWKMFESNNELLFNFSVTWGEKDV